MSDSGGVAERLHAWSPARRLALVLRLAAFCGLAGILAATLDWSRVWALLAGADPFLVVAAIAVVQLQIALSALRWQITARRLGLDLSYPRALAEYEISTAVNQILPGGVTGDLARIWRNRALDSGRWRRALRSVVFERAAGQATFLGLCGVGILAWPMTEAGAALAGLGGVASLFAVGVVLALVAGRRFAAFADLREDLARVYGRNYGWAVQGALSLMIVALYIAVFWLGAKAIGVALPREALVTAIPLALAAMLVPVAVAGFGPREAVAVLIFPALGVLPADAVAVSVAYGLINLAASLPGVPLVLKARRAQHG